MSLLQDGYQNGQEYELVSGFMPLRLFTISIRILRSQ